jgi:hypothetical protein
MIFPVQNEHVSRQEGESRRKLGLSHGLCELAVSVSRPTHSPHPPPTHHSIQPRSAKSGHLVPAGDIPMYACPWIEYATYMFKCTVFEPH